MKKFFLFIFFLSFFLFDKGYALCKSSHSCILIDNDSGRILYSKNINEERLIASTTKLMTFLVAYENGNLNDVYTVGEEVLKMYGTSIYLSLGEEISLKDLLYGLILRSGNDASVVIANNIGDGYDDFIKKMNEKAKELGMKKTTFLNPHGLDEETKNYSTSYDMAILAKYLSKIPFYLEVAGTKHYVVQTNLKTYDWYNRNKMLTQYDYTIGGKNGYTPDAGKTLVSNALKGDLSLSAVSLDDSDIYATHRDLFEFGFNTFSRYVVVNKDMFSYEDQYYGGKLYVNNSFSYPVKDGEKEKLRIVVQIIKGVDISKTDEVGNIIVYFEDDEIYRDNLFLKRSIKERTLSFLEKIWEFIKSIFS